MNTKKSMIKSIFSICIAICIILSSITGISSKVMAEDGGAGGSGAPGAGTGESGSGSAQGSQGGAAGSKTVTVPVYIDYIAKISVGDLNGYIRISDDMTKAEIYMNGEKVYTVNVDTAYSGTTRINSIGVGNAGSDASKVNSMKVSSMATSDTDYVSISCYDGADTLFINTVTTGETGILTTSGDTSVDVVESVYSNGSITKQLKSGPIDYLSALTAEELSYCTPADIEANLKGRRVHFEVHHVDTSNEINTFNDVYEYKDASGKAVLYREKITTVISATYEESSSDVWYRLDADGFYYIVNSLGAKVDGIPYVYDTETDLMKRG